MVSPVGIHPRGSKMTSPDLTTSGGRKMASPSVRSSTSRAMASCPSVTSSSKGIKAASPGVISSPEGKKMASPGVIPSGGGKVACPGVTSSPRGSKMTSPGGTLTIAANTLLITSQVILCLGSPTSQTSGPASSSPQSSSFHYALSSLHGSPSPHRGVTSPHSNPSHPGTSQPAVESGLPADGNLTSTEKVALTEGHYNDVRFTDFSRFSQAFNLTLPSSLQTPRLENSTPRSGEGNSWMNGNETGGINSPGGNPGDDEERVRGSKKHEAVQSKNASRIDVIQRLFNHSFESTLPDLQQHTADTHTAPSRDTHSHQTWGLSKKGTRLSTIPKDETSGRVRDNTIDTFGVGEVRNLKTLHHLSSVREDEDSLASLESLPKPGTKVSFLRSTTRFTGPPVTRPRGEEPAFIHVREMMVNSPRSLEQEYLSEDSTLEQEGGPSENNHLQEALSEDRRLLEGPSEDHHLQEGLSEDHLLQDGPTEDHLLQEGSSEDGHPQEGPSEDHLLQDGPTEDYRLQEDPSEEDHLQKEDYSEKRYTLLRPNEQKTKVEQEKLKEDLHLVQEHTSKEHERPRKEHQLEPENASKESHPEYKHESKDGHLEQTHASKDVHLEQTHASKDVHLEQTHTSKDVHLAQTQASKDVHLEQTHTSKDVHLAQTQASKDVHLTQTQASKDVHLEQTHASKDVHLEQTHTSKDGHLEQTHTSKEHLLEYKYTSRGHYIKQKSSKKDRHLAPAGVNEVLLPDAVMANSDVGTGSSKTRARLPSPVLKHHIKEGVNGPSMTTVHHQLRSAHTQLQQHHAHVTKGSDNTILDERSPNDTQTFQWAVSEWKKMKLAKRKRNLTPLKDSYGKILRIHWTSIPQNATMKFLKSNETSFLETNDDISEARALPTPCTSSACKTSAEEGARIGGQVEETQPIATAVLRQSLQPLKPASKQMADDLIDVDEDTEETLSRFSENHQPHHISKVLRRQELRRDVVHDTDQERVTVKLTPRTLNQSKTGGVHTLGRLEDGDDSSKAQEQKILVSSPDTKHGDLRTLTPSLQQSSLRKPEASTEDLSPKHKREQKKDERREGARPQARSPLDIQSTNHSKDPRRRRVKRNAAMVPDAMADAALVPDGSPRAPVPNNTEYLPERYHNLLQMGSRGVFRRLGTESRSGNTATAARQGGNARITEAMKTSRTSPEDGPKTSINSSRDPHNSGDLGIPRETRQGILSSTGSLPGKNNSETSHSIPPNISHGPDYSYLPPGFGGIDNGEGCSCWQTHDDSFMKEIECRCQGEHVVQLPTNLSTNVDRLTLTKTGVESLGNGNLSQYTAALQELILRDAKKLKKMETDCFRGMGRLRTIYISHAPRLTTLPPHIFHAYLPSLKVLRIVYTGLTELPNLTQLVTKTIIHMVDLENNKIQRIRGRSIKIRTEQLLLDNNMLETVEARAFHGSQIGKLSMKGNLQLKDLHPLAFKGLKSLVSLDLSETGISHLPTVGLEGLETLRLVRTYNLKVFPSVYSFKSITTAELTYHYHCCAFKFPKLHDPAEHKKHEEFLRRMEKEQCSEVTSAPSLISASQVGVGRRRRSVALEPHLAGPQPSPRPPVPQPSPLPSAVLVQHPLESQSSRQPPVALESHPLGSYSSPQPPVALESHPVGSYSSPQPPVAFKSHPLGSYSSPQPPVAFKSHPLGSYSSPQPSVALESHPLGSYSSPQPPVALESHPVGSYSSPQPPVAFKSHPLGSYSSPQPSVALESHPLGSYSSPQPPVALESHPLGSYSSPQPPVALESHPLGSYSSPQPPVAFESHPLGSYSSPQPPVALKSHPLGSYSSPQPPVALESHPTGSQSSLQPSVDLEPHLFGPYPSPQLTAAGGGTSPDNTKIVAGSSISLLPSDKQVDSIPSRPPSSLRRRPLPTFSTPPTPSSSPSTPSSPPLRPTTSKQPGDVSSQGLLVSSQTNEARKFSGEERLATLGVWGASPGVKEQPRLYDFQASQGHQDESTILHTDDNAVRRGDSRALETGTQEPPLTVCRNGRCAKGRQPGLLQQQKGDGATTFISRATRTPERGALEGFSGHGNDDSRTGRDRPIGPVKLQMGLDVFIDVHRGDSGGRVTSGVDDGGVGRDGWVKARTRGVPVHQWQLEASDKRYPPVRDRKERVASTKSPSAVEKNPSDTKDTISGFGEHEGSFSNAGFSELDNFGFQEEHDFDIDDRFGTHLPFYPGGDGGVGVFNLDADHGFPEDYDPDECVNGLCPKTARLPHNGPGFPFDPNKQFEAKFPFEQVEVYNANDGFRPVLETSVEGTADGHSGSPHGQFHNKVSLNQGIRTVCRGNLSKNYRDVQCVPEPDAFNPCEDIMGNLGLRVAVWVVVVTAVFGNLAVMVVLMSTRFKMTVSKFLMCNLAGADLCMGLYLLIIAAMDLRTIGVYFNYAIDWQNGPGCKVAGFLTVFASELSILTLTVITLERWYAITYAIHLNKRLRLSVAVRVMMLAWLYAVTMATLPLLGVSGYSKTSICLPMETVDGADQAYLLILLITNGLAFILICVCYAKMYCSIAGNNLAANTSDTTVAKRMALLVFTDFACWAPIAFFGLTAVSGYPLISVTHAKFLLVFFYPLNSCANPYLYAILTKQYRRDLFILLARHGFCTKRAMKYKGGYSTNTWLNHHNVCVSGGTGGGSGGPSRRISTLTQITTCGDWRSRVRDGSEESLGRQCSPSRARSISAELTVPSPMTMGLADRRLSDVGRRLQPVAEVRDGRASPKPGLLAPTSGSPHPIKNCYARMSFTPEQEALLLRYASDRQPSVTPSNARRRMSPSERDETVPLSIYTPTTPDTITTPISPQLDHSV